MYDYSVLDPRPAGNNESIFERPCYGIEVTVPALIKRCYYNLDPQHREGLNQAAIEAALTADLPAKGSTLVTVRPDLDSFGSMAIFSFRKEGEAIDSAMMERIAMIADSDKFAKGGYPGSQPLPKRENLAVRKPLAAIAAAIADYKVPPAERVAMMKKWLQAGEEPIWYREKVEKERLEMIEALESGQIKCELRSNGRIAVVESSHRSGTAVGYCLAPVVIACNPDFKQGSVSCRKLTICAYQSKFADIKSALAELNELEPGWGGATTIGGSPQGVSSELTVDQVVMVLEKYLQEEE